MKTSLLAVAITTLSLAGCASMQPASPVRVDVAETGLPNCQSFAWIPAKEDAASLTEQRVKSAVMTQLKAKGYSESADKPDCRITYVLNLTERPKQKPSVGVGAGGGSGGIGGGIGISLPIGKRNEQSGTFTLDVVDANKNAQVWSGSLDASFSKAELTEEEAGKVVEKVLERYPNKK